jgi:hypothetical protein
MCAQVRARFLGWPAPVGAGELLSRLANLYEAGGRGASWLALPVAGLLAGCAAPGGEGTGAEAAGSRAVEESACAAVVAEHVGLGPGDVVATWRERRPDGIAVVEVRDGDRLHTCDVDAAGRVLSIDHPPG